MAGSHFRVPFTMTSRITELARPEHRFVRTGARAHGCTGARVTMIDSLSFDAPLGPIGRLTERLLLERYLRELIAARGTYLKQQAER